MWSYQLYQHSNSLGGRPDHSPQCEHYVCSTNPTAPHKAVALIASLFTSGGLVEDLTRESIPYSVWRGTSNSFSDLTTSMMVHRRNMSWYVMAVTHPCDG